MSIAPSHEEEVEFVRRRPGMYFGSTGERGTEQFVYELVGNVLDSYLINQATFVNVKLEGAVISVVDDGPGLPFDEPSDQQGVNLATKLLTRLHRTPSYDEHTPHVHMTYSGLGLAPLNAASVQLTVQSWRGGLLWEQRFIRGFAQSAATVIKRGDGRGTKIEIIPDPELFGQAQPRPGCIRRDLFETAHLFGGLKIGFQEERFHAPLGLQMLGLMLLAPIPIYSDVQTPPFHLTLCHENVLIEAAAFGDRRKRTRNFSWVNGARTPEQGSHVEGFLQALNEVGWKPELSLIHVVMYEPEFAGPTRYKLDVPHIRDVVNNGLSEPLSQYYGERQDGLLRYN